MISFEEALSIHSILIDKFGGATGIRDRELLISALERPFQTFDGKDLYPTPTSKAAAIIESIVKNHPFIDGNKRTGYVLARLTLMDSQIDLIASQIDKYNFVIAISKGELDFEQIENWIKSNSR